MDTILITGCSKGIGKALAMHFAKENHTVYAVARDETALNALAQFSGCIYPIAADISTQAGRKHIADQLKSKTAFSLIHNAAIAEPTPFIHLHETAMRKHFETNFFAALLLTQNFLPQLKGQRVLNITTGAAVSPQADLFAYCTSKGAMRYGIECLNTEFSSHGIDFGNLRPGMVDTHLQKTFRTASEKQLSGAGFYRKVESEGRLIRPETAAAFAAWVLLKTDAQAFTKTFWNIYDTTHQAHWLPQGHSKPTPP